MPKYSTGKVRGRRFWSAEPDAKATPIRETGFAAVNIDTNPPHIMVWSVAGSASGVRKAVADNWPIDPHGLVSGWKAAMRSGVRVRKIKIKTV